MPKPTKKQSNVVIPPADDEEAVLNDGFKFADMVEMPKTSKGVPIPQEPGKGRKQCSTPGCGLFVAPTTEVCPKCNQPFVKGAKKAGTRKYVTKGRLITTETEVQTTTAELPNLSMIRLLKVLKGRGLNFKVSVDPLETNPKPEITDNMKVKNFIDQINFSATGENPTGIVCRVTGESIRFTLDLDTMLNLVNLK